MRRRVSTAMDSDALQADVMRFMAIIAFCLVAVLALVRQIEPAAAEDPDAKIPELAAEAEPSKPQPLPASGPTPASEAATAGPAAVESTAASTPADFEETRPLAAMQPELDAATPEAAPILRPIEPLAAPETVAEVAVVQPPQPAEVAAAEPMPGGENAAEPAAPESEQGESGLILRFATDQDFLRLVAKGDIRVFLFGADNSFRLRSDYRFAPATAPRQLFEVMPATVPALIRQRAATLPEVSALRYGLEFPDRIERQLDAYLAQVESGALLIDRFGHVSHVSTKQ